MRVLMADDTEMHRTLFKATVEQLSDLGLQLIGQATNGAELVQMFKDHSVKGPIDMVFSDIRMPVMDGLSALVKIKAINPNQTVIMVSSEDLSRMEMLNSAKGEQDKANVDLAKKMELLNKIADRIKAGTIEPGKINSILEGCEKLAIDPVLVAEKYGSRGYVKKPYDLNKLRQAITSMKDAGFITVL